MSVDLKKLNELLDAAADKDSLGELNLETYLKGREDLEYFSPCYGPVKIYKWENDKIIIQNQNQPRKYHTLLRNGKHQYGSSLCMIYPSEKLYFLYPLDPKKAWDEWIRNQANIRTVNIETTWLENGEIKKDIKTYQLSNENYNTVKEIIENLRKKPSEQ